MEVDASPRHLVQQPGSRNVALTANVPCARQRSAIDAPHIDRYLGRKFFEQISTDSAPPAAGFVDHGGDGGQFSGVQVARIGYAVVDHSGRGGTVVPHQTVEVGDMYHWDVVTPRDRMNRVDGGGPRRVVFDIDGGDVDARTATEPPSRQLDLTGPLQHNQVDVFFVQPPPRNLLSPWPIAAAQAAAIRIFAFVGGDHAAMPAGDE